MAEMHKFDPRERLAIELDGAAFESADTTYAVYRGLLAAMEPRFLSTLNAIRRLAPEEIVLADGCSDEIASLFQLMGLPASAIERPVLDLSHARLAVFGCFGRSSQPSGEDLAAFFGHGGVLVTSDKALVGLDYHFPGILIDDPAPLRRGRMVISRRSTRGWGRLAKAGSALATAVTLEAGHIPIDAIPDEAEGVRVLAHEALGGRPLVVAVPVGRGWLVHSVAHWYQLAPRQPTEIESRTIDTLGRHIQGLDVPPEASFGLFMAARTMLFTLLSGLEIAFIDQGFDSAAGRS